MTLDGLVEAYLNHLRVERALSPRTLEAYGRDLNKLLAFAEESGIDRAEAVDLGAISGWLSRMAALPGWKSAYDLLPGKRLTHYAK